VAPGKSKPRPQPQPIAATPDAEREAAYAYIRYKVNQLLTVMGTLPVRPEELDDATLIALDPIGIIADSFRQILSHLNQTNQALEVARDELRTVLESAGAAILVVDREAEIELCNRPADELLVDGQVRSVEREIIEGILRSGSGVERSDLIRNGQHYHMIATPLNDPDGEVSRVVFCYTDISEQKEHQRQLEHIAHYDTLTESARCSFSSRISSSACARCWPRTPASSRSSSASRCWKRARCRTSSGSRA
jgi:PAS domain-containing protein